VIEGDDGKPICDLPTLHKKFLETWFPIFNMHKDTKPDFDIFADKYRDVVIKHDGAPSTPPDGLMLYQQAQRNKTKSSGGMDGVTPFELKILPLEAWNERAQYLALSYKLGVSAKSYYHVAMPLLEKEDKMEGKKETHTFRSTKDFRLLSLFTAILRVETGAAYRQHMQWMLSWFNKDMHGGIPNHESAEVSWDLQSGIELAMINNKKLAVCLMDYMNFFDSMEPIFMAKLMIATGYNAQFVQLNLNLYQNLHRYIKIGKSYGKPFSASNGLGQGDSFSLMVALTLVSIQFDFLAAKYPRIRAGSCVDDRNIRGPVEDVMLAYADIAEFDKLTGHFNNPKKLAMSAVHKNCRKKLAIFNVGTQDVPIFPRIFLKETLVGDFINVTRSPARQLSDKRIVYTIQAANRVVRCPCGQALRARAVDHKGNSTHVARSAVDFSGKYFNT